MNQQIRFRAWDVYKEMFIPTDVWAVICTDFGAIGIMLKDWEDYREGEYFYKNTQIVSQFTTKTDKHGKEIYCGDKLQKIYEDKCEEGGFGKTIVDVAFKDGAFGWIGEITGNFHPFAVEPFEDSEIIGNIHQNSK